MTPLMLELDLSRGPAESPPSDPLTALRRRQLPLVHDVVDGLRRGAHDPAVAGCIVLMGSGPGSLAQGQEVGEAIEQFAAAGKATLAFAESFGELGPGAVSYALATSCDQVWLQPSGLVGLTGVTLDVTLLRGLLDKVGATPMVGQRHEYKSAADSLLRRQMSDPHREMAQRLTDSALEQVVATMLRRRRLDRRAVVAAFAAAPVPAAAALALGLVDRLGYRHEAYAELRRRLGSDGNLRLQFVHRYARKRASRPVEQARARRRPVVALVPIRGSIVTGHTRPGGLLGPLVGSDTVASTLDRVSRDDAVKAVVLRVDSPGGSYVASDAIRSAVQAVQATGRAVVASMGRLAASGGYFVSMPADRVVALPATLTGSIGVLAGKVVVTETLARLGVTRETVGSGPQATMFSATLPYDDEQWQRLQAWLDAVYADFVGKAAADRRQAPEELEPQARGRVWTGADARERGLVDDLGGLERAVQVACNRAGLRRDRVQLRRPRVGVRDRVRGPESTASPAAVVGAAGSDLVGGLTAMLGAPPTGVLSLPWDLRLG